MSNKKLSGKALVIQITREETRIGLVRLGQTNPDLQASLILPTPEGAVEDGEIRNLTAMKDILRPALEDPVFRRVRRCVFVLCSSRVISATTKIPAKQKNARLNQLLHANMDEYFPIQTEDYLLTWETAGLVETDGFKEKQIQLWAVPRLLVSRYYELAAGLGRTVAAVDYCGNSAAAAAGATFTISKKAHKESGKKGLTLGKKKQAEEFDTAPVAVLDEPVGESSLYLHVDDDSIISTFVTDGQVKLQRLVQRGFSLEADLGETAIAMEYFNALPDTDGAVNRVVLSGSAVGEVLDCNGADILGVPTEILPCMPDSSWALVLGASRTKLDFGIVELSRDGSEAKLWQFILVFAGAGALMAVIMLFMTSSLTWSTELGSLRNTQNQMMILAQQNSGAADEYHAYESAYNAYNMDWAMLQGSIRTYNDNLGLILDEFEGKIPSSATVTTLTLTDQSVAAQLAFKKLEDVAFFIQGMRDLKYANMDGISSVSMGPYYTAEMLRAMQGQTTDATGDLFAALMSGGMEGLDGTGLTQDQLMELVAAAQQDTNSASIDMGKYEQLMKLYQTMYGGAAPTEGSLTEEAPTEGGAFEDLLSAAGLDMKDMDMDSLLPIIMEANGPLMVEDVLRYNRIMEAAKTGDISKAEPGDLAFMLNIMDKANGGSGERFTEKEIELLLGLVGGTSGGISGDMSKEELEDLLEDILSGKTDKDEVEDLIQDIVGGNTNIKDEQMQEIIDGILGGGSVTVKGNYSQLLEANGITVEKLRLNLQNLTLKELEDLQSGYGADFNYDEEDLEKFLKKTERRPNVRKDALESLLENDPKKMEDDPAAMYHFFLLLREDAEKKEKDQILYNLIEKDLKNDEGVYDMIFKTSTQKSLDKNLDKFIRMLITKQKVRLAAEELIQTDVLLSSKFAAHLDAVLYNKKKVDTSVDMEQILADLRSGDVMDKPLKVQNAVMALLGEKVAGLYKAAVTAPINPGFNLGDLLGGGAVQQIQPEIRYFITVSMSYKDELILAELQRKGLDFSIKVDGPLQVDGAQEVSQ